nr:ABC transporter permease [uncultured Methanospirillum sp.]
MNNIAIRNPIFQNFPHGIFHSVMTFVLKKKMLSIAIFFLILLIGVAIFAPQIAPYDPLKTSLKHKIEGPSWEHPFGTDELGRDILSRIIYGARVSLLISSLVVGLSLLIGISLGLTAAYYGGIYDEFISRVIDVFLSFPGILISLPLLAFLMPGIGSMVIVLTITNWTTFARLIRNETYSIKNMEFIQSAKLSGLPNLYIMFRHILPNIIAPLIVLATIDVGSTILHIASLSYLGLGIPTNIPEWGSMVSAGKEFIRSAPLLTLVPGLAITFVVLLFNYIGEELRGILNPVSNEGPEL